MGNDIVDKITEQWSREMPGLNTAPLQVFGRIERVSEHLRRHMETYLGEFELHRSEFAVLAVLRRTGEPYCMSPTELFRTLLRSSGTMTNTLQKLEDAGLIAREQNPEDKRSSMVRLTSAGKKIIERAARFHVEKEQDIIQGFSRNEQDELARLLKKILIFFEDF